MRRLWSIIAFSWACTGTPTREPFVLRIAIGGPLGEVSPTEEGGGWATLATPWVFERFVSVDARGDLTPVRAARIHREDRTAAHLEVRTGCCFSDGQPVEEVDLVRSLEAAGLLVTVRGTALTIAPRQRGLPSDALLLNARVFRGSAGHFVGSGPFKIASQTASELRLVRRVPRPDRINDVRLIAYPSPRDAYMHTLKGDANFLYDLEPRWVELFQGIPSLQVLRIPPKNADALTFNGQLPRAERRGLAAALDSEQLRQLAYGPSECAESRNVAPSSASLPPGSSLRILSWGSNERLGLAARRVLGDRGGEVLFLDPKDVLTHLERGDYAMMTSHPNRWPPITVALNWRTGAPFNLFGYSNPQVDRAVDAGDWAAAEEALRDDPPAVYVCTRNFFAVIDARVRNVSFGPLDALQTLPDWELLP
ncbi:MAG TPA: hypothetical protein VMK66_02205 [Myxococcales bacterium]|nr:hypothetical protein [Myxococcales bacterium]